jgi:YidC/Oxa1 family membrane protein insertase
MDREDLRNWVVFAVLAFGILGFYQVFVYGPQEAQRRAAVRAESAAQVQVHGGATPTAPSAFIPRAQAEAASPRVKVDTPSLAGSISLRGAKIDDLYMKHYRETLDPKSPLVELFRPEGAEHAWFAETGWQGATANMPGIPDDNTLWTAPAGGVLTPTTPLVLTYDNGAGLTFTRTIAVDADYMFQITDTVTNAGAAPVSLAPRGLIAEVGQPATLAKSGIVHEGAIGMLAHNLVLDKYADWKKKTEPTTVTSTGGWLGITQKYWLSALIPDQTMPIQGEFQVVPSSAAEVYEATYVGAAQTVAPGASFTQHSRLFAGAKVVPLLRNYEYSGSPPAYYWSTVTPHATDIPRFDQSVDWGHLFFLTQPLFDFLEFFNHHLGSIGMAILALTVVVRLVFFPLANKSFESMSKMKKIQPMVEELKKKFEKDQTKLQQETMALYQREKINPLMGCLPMLVQIPVFYSLYKVLTVTIEMRQAPFFGWIHDLSARDPTSIWTLFGLIPWNPALAPLIGGYLDGPLHIGLFPLIYGFTMWLSMSMSPPAGDPMQQRLFQLMPLIFTFTLAQVTVGLLIYWTWSSLLTILQQYFIMHRFKVDNPIDGLIGRFVRPKPRPSG